MAPAELAIVGARGGAITGAIAAPADAVLTGLPSAGGGSAFSFDGLNKFKRDVVILCCFERMVSFFGAIFVEGKAKLSGLLSALRLSEDVATDMGGAEGSFSPGISSNTAGTGRIFPVSLASTKSSRRLSGVKWYCCERNSDVISSKALAMNS